MKFIPSKTRKDREFWVTNTSLKKDISIPDLRVVIRAGTSVNLMDQRHYSFTYEQLQKSMESGSLAAKKSQIALRNLPPVFAVSPGVHKAVGNRITQLRAPSVVVNARVYQELGDQDLLDNSILDEKRAAEMADIVHNDNVPALAKDPRLVTASTQLDPNQAKKIKQQEQEMEDYLAGLEGDIGEEE